MSETRSTTPENGQKRITELRVSGHLMTLDTGTFCVFHAPGSASGGNNALGLPGVRISLPPGPVHNPDEVSISTFRPDGWLGGSDAAALIRVASGPAQVLVTIYQAPGQNADQAPRLQVLRLSPEQPAQAGQAIVGRAGMAQAGTGNGAMPTGMASGPNDQGTPEIIVHMQLTGDVGCRVGEWAGIRGSHNWIEGFALVPPAPLKPEDIEYQAVLGRGWLSPWSEGGQFCGSRGMALPILGLRVQLRGQAAQRYATHVTATFTDGTRIGPVEDGELVEATSLAPLEAFQVSITDRLTGKAIGAAPIATPGQAPRPFAQTPAPAPAPRARPAAPAPKPAAPAPKPVAKAPAKPAKGGKAAPAAKSGKASTTRRG